MDILVDDAAPPVECRPTDRLGLFMDRLREALAGEGRVLVGVLVDGAEPTMEDWSDLVGESLENVGRLRITSAPVMGAALSTLEVLLGALEPLRAEQARVVEALQAGNRSEGFRHFALCIATWDVLQRSLLQVSGWLQRAEMLPEGDDLVDSSQALVEGLSAVEAALKDGDILAVSDAIEEQLDPLVDRWQDLCVGLVRHLSVWEGEDENGNEEGDAGELGEETEAD